MASDVSRDLPLRADLRTTELAQFFRSVWHRRWQVHVHLPVLLQEAGWEFQEDVEIRGDRVDAIVSGDLAVVIERERGPFDVLPRLERLAKDPAIGGIVVMAGDRALISLPLEINGKVVAVVDLAAS